MLLRLMLQRGQMFLASTMLQSVKLNENLFIRFDAFISDTNFFLNINLLLGGRGFSCALFCTLCVRVCMIESGNGLLSVLVGAVT